LDLDLTRVSVWGRKEDLCLERKQGFWVWFEFWRRDGGISFGFGSIFWNEKREFDLEEFEFYLKD